MARRSGIETALRDYATLVPLFILGVGVLKALDMTDVSETEYKLGLEVVIVVGGLTLALVGSRLRKRAG